MRRRVLAGRWHHGRRVGDARRRPAPRLGGAPRGAEGRRKATRHGTAPWNHAMEQHHGTIP
eukprot:1842303-Prymnesium_polylepis.2